MINLYKNTLYLEDDGTSILYLNLDIDRHDFLSYNDNIKDYDKYIDEDLSKIYKLETTTIYGPQIFYFKNRKLHSLTECAILHPIAGFYFIDGKKIAGKNWEKEILKYKRKDKINLLSLH